MCETDKKRTRCQLLFRHVWDRQAGFIRTTSLEEEADMGNGQQTRADRRRPALYDVVVGSAKQDRHMFDRHL